MLTLHLDGPHTRILSGLCQACPQGNPGCCRAPPAYDWSDLGRLVLQNQRDFLLTAIAARNLLPNGSGLLIRRVRRRESATDRRQPKCIFHCPTGCTLPHTARPGTCNYFVCEDVYRTDLAQANAAIVASVRQAASRLASAYQAVNVQLGERLRNDFPDGPPWGTELLDWLGANFEARLPEFSTLATTTTSGKSQERTLPPPDPSHR